MQAVADLDFVKQAILLERLISFLPPGLPDLPDSVDIGLVRPLVLLEPPRSCFLTALNCTRIHPTSVPRC